MTRNVEITFEWGQANFQQVLPQHEEALENFAMRAIEEARQDYCIGGELQITLEGTDYRGSWSCKMIPMKT